MQAMGAEVQLAAFSRSAVQIISFIEGCGGARPGASPRGGRGAHPAAKGAVPDGGGRIRKARRRGIIGGMSIRHREVSERLTFALYQRRD